MVRAVLMLYLALVPLGCRAVAGYGTASNDALPRADQSLIDAARDGAYLDLVAPDSETEADLGAICGRAPGPGLIARYTLDDGPGPFFASSIAGAPDAELVGDDYTVVADDGSGCGQALSFDRRKATDAYLTIPDHPLWDLVEGAISLRFKPTRSTLLEGLLGRDAYDANEPGHLSIFRTIGGQIWVRLQRGAGKDTYVCSEGAATPEGVWHHIGINFGPAGLELWIDGKRADSSQPILEWGGTSTISCGNAGVGGGIAGNHNPWVVGSSNVASGDGSATPVTEPFAGQIDEIRIYSSRQAFDGS